MPTVEVTEANAYRFSDNFTITDSDGLNVYGCEHNQQEADAIAKWLANYHSKKIVVIHNGPDQVRRSKEIRGNTPFQVKRREDILKETGVWK